MIVAKAQEYSAVEHLAKSIGLYTGTALMAMLTAYTDDSGTHQESEIAVAGGFVSDVGKWGPGKFETDWRMALKVAGILDEGFHMSKFMARKGVYEGWLEHERNQLYNSLILAINKHTHFGFGAAVRKDDYDHLVTGKLREKLGGHYRFVVGVCMWELQTIIRRGMPEPVTYVFARGTKGNHEVNVLFQELSAYPKVRDDYGIDGGISFQPTRKVYPLQAADIVAWSSLRYLNTRDPSSKEFLPEVTREVEGRLFTRKELERYVPEITEKYEATNWEGPPAGFL